MEWACLRNVGVVVVANHQGLVTRRIVPLWPLRTWRQYVTLSRCSPFCHRSFCPSIRSMVSLRRTSGRSTKASASLFEFWHGTSGRVTPRLFRQYCTRLRQAVASFNAGAWIILIIDCSTCHLDLASVHHLRRRGILAIFVPAKLTWLMQLLDVFCFKALKSDFREAQARARSFHGGPKVFCARQVFLAVSWLRN